MLYDKYHEFFSRQCKVLRQKQQQLSAKYTIFFIHLREGKFGPGGTGPSSTRSSKGQKKRVTTESQTALKSKVGHNRSAGKSLHQAVIRGMEMKAQ